MGGNLTGDGPGQRERLRGLGTARAVLRVLSYLQKHPEGVTPSEVATWLGKSTHTAYYLLNSLCQEGYAWRGQDRRYRPQGTLEARGPGAAPLDTLVATLAEVNRVTRCRAYLVVMENGEPLLEEVIGHRGQPGVQLDKKLRRVAHATAVGKAILAGLPNEQRQVFIRESPLEARTPHTLTDPDVLEGELLAVQFHGVAYDRQEYQEGVYCLAVPVRVALSSPREPLLASLGIVVTPYRFFAEGQKLKAQLLSEVNKLSQPLGTA